MRVAFLFLLMIVAWNSFATAIDSLAQRKLKTQTWIEKKQADEDDERFYFKRHVQPHSINALISYCETQWMQEEKDSFKAMPEAIAVRHNHYWYAGWISLRTMLIADSAIVAEFKAKGITDYDQMWTLILTSLHRKLNGQDINLTAQIEELKKKRKKK